MRARTPSKCFYHRWQYQLMTSFISCRSISWWFLLLVSAGSDDDVVYLLLQHQLMTSFTPYRSISWWCLLSVSAASVGDARLVAATVHWNHKPEHRNKEKPADHTNKQKRNTHLTLILNIKQANKKRQKAQKAKRINHWNTAAFLVN